MELTPSQAARVLSVSPPTLRRWASLLSDQLSAQAAPPKGRRRAYTESDITVLRAFKELLEAGLSVAEARERLAQGLGAEAQVGLELRSQPLALALGDAIIRLADQRDAIERLQARQEALERELDELRQAIAKPQDSLWARLRRRFT
jgi:DNA-binding transcriptional MerR regulator